MIVKDIYPCIFIFLASSQSMIKVSSCSRQIWVEESKLTNKCNINYVEFLFKELCGDLSFDTVVI